MDKRIKENIRVKNQIANAFFQLLEDCNEDEETITISQITSKAGVSRMAYYRNFKSKSNIVDYYLSEKLQKDLFIKLSKQFDFWSIEYGTVFWELMKSQRDTLLLLRKHGYGDSILSAFTKCNEELIGDMPHNSIERYKIYYAAGASYNATIHWLDNGCKEPPRSLAENFAEFCRLLNYPTL